MTIPSDLPIESILDCIADGVFTIDLNWSITYFNRAAEKITKIPKQEALGQKCWEVFHSSICDGACVLSQCLKGNCPLTTQTVYIVRPDGEKIHISISAAPLFNPQGKLIGGVETFRDLTALNHLQEVVEQRYSLENIISKDAKMGKIFKILPNISQSTAPVLLTGESGTGKELFARAIHDLSPRSKRQMISINCGALPEQLLESELFGYKAGAFTDAKTDKPGFFSQADGSTFFLDEIGELSPALQVKLLRVLQEQQFYALGATIPTQVDVRVIAATNQDLKQAIAKGKFRSDLFYRLSVVHLDLPPLRERIGDLPLLIGHFIKKFNALQHKDIQGISEEALGLLLRHSFPGNVRELENIIDFAFILCNQGIIQVEHLPEYLLPSKKQDTAVSTRPQTLEAIKCQAVLAALKRNKGKKMATCRELGISKDTLRRMIKRCQETTQN